MMKGIGTNYDAAADDDDKILRMTTSPKNVLVELAVSSASNTGEQQTLMIYDDTDTDTDENLLVWFQSSAR
jgi:hypothetical protein